MSARISGQQACSIIARNVHKFEVFKDITLNADGKPLLSYSPIDALEANDHSLKIHLGNIIDIKNGLVGFPGFHYSPYVVGARDVPTSLAAWRWFDAKLSGSYGRVAAFIVGGHIVRAVMGGLWTSLLSYQSP